MEKRDDKNLSNVVIRKVQEMILSGELQEGDKLPPEREMTQRLGIGRPALREGLKSLEMLGLVERRHGLGNFIINKVQASYFEPLSLSFMLNHGTESEIFEMRSCLETYTAAKAAEIATPSDIRSLRAIAQQMVSARTAFLKKASSFLISKEIPSRTFTRNTRKSSAPWSGTIPKPQRQPWKNTWAISRLHTYKVTKTGVSHQRRNGVKHRFLDALRRLGADLAGRFAEFHGKQDLSDTFFLLKCQFP